MLSEQRKRQLYDGVKHIPIVKTLGFELLEVDDGYCKAVVPHDHRFDGVFKSFHGGLLMTVADSLACFAIMTLTGTAEPLTTTDMNIRFLAPCRTDATAVARVIKLGKTLCPVSVDLYDADGVLVAVAQVNYIRLHSLVNNAARASS